MRHAGHLLRRLAIFVVVFSSQPLFAADHDDLVALFHDWRAFEQPPLLNGAPDYTTATNARRHDELKDYQARLAAMDISDWPVELQVDWHLVRAEMNGMEFNFRVLRPWERDPAFYAQVWTAQSDTPAHEGPTNHALVELWTYSFPLDDAAEARLAAELETIPPLLAQARGNLTGNARELWIAGIQNLRDQAVALADLRARLERPGARLEAAVAAAASATDEFVAWLEVEGEKKDGPSGIGIEDYTWSQRNVHYVPMTWEDEVRLLRRELDRAWSSLALEEHRNRALPPLEPIASPEAYAAHAERSVRRLADFLVEGEVLPAYDYIEPVLREHMGQFVPAAQRNFFWTVVHYEPMVLWTHWYHWLDHAHMAVSPHPSPVRRGALLYNIWDSRSEGLSTGFEEITMQAGLYDDNPRARELVWIMLAQRAARGLGSLQAQANVFTLKEARDFHVAWTPRGWMREDLDLLGFEQLLYLRQPGYGTSYITGKYLVERLMAERKKQQGDAFSLREFFAEVDEAGVIPVSLIRWQMTGDDSEIRALMAPPVSVAPASPTPEQEAFFQQLGAHCGATFTGTTVFPEDPGEDWKGQVLVAHISTCDDRALRVPLSVGEDNSRTWIIRKVEGGLELKHDHRHADGTPDEVTLYGGTTRAPGTALAQSFPADDYTADLIPEAATNEWFLSLSEDGSELTYYLERHGKPRFKAVLTRD